MDVGPQAFDRGSISVVLLTPPGRSAVATLLVSGAGAAAAVEQLFAPASGKKIAAASAGEIVFGRWDGAGGEELVVCRRDESEIEIHCHGGEAAVAAVLASLVEVGCREVGWPAWICGHSEDPIVPEAVEALGQAATLRCAAVLLDQYHGALRRELNRCAELMETADGTKWSTAIERLQRLLRRASVGRHLVSPFRVVVCGKPNVGKSSLVNAMVGYQRSIVYDQPGTTRDVVSVRTAIAGWPVELSDTAGLRPGDDPLEAAGVRLAFERIAAADLRLLVLDASQLLGGEDHALLAQWPDALAVYNKSDLATTPISPPGIATSAILGQGIDDLVHHIGERLVPEPPDPGEAVPFTERQEQVITKAIELLRRGERAAAAQLLRS